MALLWAKLIVFTLTALASGLSFHRGLRGGGREVDAASVGGALLPWTIDVKAIQETVDELVREYRPKASTSRRSPILFVPSLCGR